MITLLIPATAKLIEDAGTASEMFRRLKRHWYLSLRGRLDREGVIALIQQVIDDYPRTPEEIVYGSELSQDIIGALNRAGYISIFGRTWGRIGRRR